VKSEMGKEKIRGMRRMEKQKKSSHIPRFGVIGGDTRGASSRTPGEEVKTALLCLVRS